MDIFNVNIYIETLVRGPKSKKAAGEWLVEFITRKGVTVTRSGIICKEEISENALTLELLKDAFSILTKNCSIRVNTQCGHVLGAIQNHWLTQWKKRDWVNAKGSPVANRELWQQVSELMEHHLVEFDSGWHPYREVMQGDIRREIGGSR